MYLASTWTRMHSLFGIYETVVLLLKSLDDQTSMARSLYSLQTSCIDNYLFASGYGEQVVLSGTVAFSDPDLNGFWLISPRGDLMKPLGFSWRWSSYFYKFISDKGAAAHYRTRSLMIEWGWKFLRAITCCQSCPISDCLEPWQVIVDSRDTGWKLEVGSFCRLCKPGCSLVYVWCYPRTP